MKLNKTPAILESFSFGEKMKICREYSVQFLPYLMNGLTENDLNSKVLPWDLETFALLSVFSDKESENANFETRKSQEIFINILNSIQNHNKKITNVYTQNQKLERDSIVYLGNQQFQLQEPAIYKLYRFNYFFNFENEKINMKQKFKEKFGTSYDDFLLCAFFITSALDAIKRSGLSYDEKSLTNFFYKKYAHVFSNLTQPRQDFISLQKEVTQDVNDFPFCFKYFNQFPFIKHDEKIYAPLPHLLYQAITSSLLFRLTEGNNTLRATFGKEVLESYLFEITSKSSSIYDEILPEKRYKGKKGDFFPPDLTLKKEDMCVLIDIKSMAPKRDTRILEASALKSTIEMSANKVVQLYKTINNDSHAKFCEYSTLNKENIFGLIIVLEDSYILRKDILNVVSSKLNLSEDSIEFKWLCSNIKFINLYTYEQLVFHNKNIFTYLNHLKDNENELAELGIVDFQNIYGEDINENILISTFIKDLRTKVQELVPNLVEQGILTPTESTF